MHFREGEVALKTVRRHVTPYIFKIAKISLVAVPVYLLAYFVGAGLNGNVGGIFTVVVTFFLAFIFLLVSFDYILDRLVITNQRVIWVNWQSPIKKIEHEVQLTEIQDIKTHEKGIFSRWKAFDYGYLAIETAGSKTSIAFDDCRNPEAAKHFILLHLSKLKGAAV